MRLVEFNASRAARTHLSFPRRLKPRPLLDGAPLQLRVCTDSPYESQWQTWDLTTPAARGPQVVRPTTSAERPRAGEAAVGAMPRPTPAADDATEELRKVYEAEGHPVHVGGCGRKT